MIPQLRINLDRQSGRPIGLQIYEQIRSQAESGALSEGFRLPPSRELAVSLSVSRKTVAEAYQQLLTEGFLLTRGKGGTFVKPIGKPLSVSIPERVSQQILDNLAPYGQSVRTLKLAKLEPRENVPMSLYSSNPDIDNSSVSAWFEKTAGRLKTMIETSALSGLGQRRLRQAICRYVADTRGIDCEEEQVAILSGFPQFIDLAIRLHAAPGDRVVVEDPCYPAMRESAFAYGADIYPVPVDSHGIMVEELPSNNAQNRSKLIFLTSAHQFPTGSVLPIERRYKILDWASKAGTVVVDDDYDSDLFFKGFPPPPLKAMQNSQSVIYVSSLKKLVPSSFSVDFAILPDSLSQVYSQAMKLSGSQPSARAQLILAEFINTGEIFKQIKRMKLVYSARRDLLLECLNKYFGQRIEVSGAACGLDMIVRVDSTIADSEIVRRAQAAGVELQTTQDFYCRNAKKGEFIIGYAAIEDEQIDQAVKVFATAAGLRLANQG